MIRKKNNHRIIEIKPEFESILICNNKKLAPFIQVLIQEPENISHQNLGTLIGVFEVNDNSEDSSYIVNYLISVIKKEYFSKPKRGPVESLEASLHKANLALSNLAEHENIDWLGKLNALVAVTEKNGLHFSQAGNASALLLRSKILTDISDGLSPSDSEPNPMKTFVNVSSGRMEKDDKLLIATSNIFDIFSLEEIKKSALRFSKKDFVQFLRTALGSELEKAAVLVADFNQKEFAAEKSPAKKTAKKQINVFSNDAFKDQAAGKKVFPETAENELQKEIQKSQPEFVDQKTGHIYIKENFDADAPEKEKVNYLSLFFEKLQRAYHSTIASAKNNGSKALAISVNIAKMIFLKLLALAKNIFSEKNKKNLISFGKNTAETFEYFFSKITPQFQKIKRIVLAMDYQQKIYALLILVLIFVVPFFIAGFLNRKAEEENAPVISETIETPALPLEQDANVARIDSPALIYSGNNIQKILNLNNKFFAITTTEIFDLEKNKSFPIPQEFGAPVQITGMSDLNLIFLLNKNNSVISFSPISGDFKNNNLPIPAGADIRAIGTYLTYIYLVDAKNNQIYRYPRAEGGFGEKIDWLKDSTGLSDANILAMNENIFASDGKNIIKLFKGKAQDFKIQETATPIAITAIALGEQTGNVFILDAKNSRVIQLDSENKITPQYYNPEITSAKSIAASEENKTIYLSTENKIETIAMQ